jgi:hypothetical protein
MATYKQIQDDICSRDERVMPACWIAHVRELNDLAPRQSRNRISADNQKKPCSAECRPLTEESMRWLRMLS